MAFFEEKNMKGWTDKPEFFCQCRPSLQKWNLKYQNISHNILQGKFEAKLKKNRK